MLVIAFCPSPAKIVIMKQTTANYDEPWKEALTEYFEAFLHFTATENANDETEEKENSIFKFSTRNIRRQRILTYESRRRFEDT